MKDFVDVCAIADIPNGKHRAFNVSGVSILIFRLNSELFALENLCSHLALPLAGGRQIGCEIICPAHGARFNIRTGKAVGPPAVDPLVRFEVHAKNERVEVRLQSAHEKTSN